MTAHWRGTTGRLRPGRCPASGRRRARRHFGSPPARWGPRPLASTPQKNIARCRRRRNLRLVALDHRALLLTVPHNARCPRGSAGPSRLPASCGGDGAHHRGASTVSPRRGPQNNRSRPPVANELTLRRPVRIVPPACHRLARAAGHAAAPPDRDPAHLYQVTVRDAGRRCRCPLSTGAQPPQKTRGPRRDRGATDWASLVKNFRSSPLRRSVPAPAAQPGASLSAARPPAGTETQPLRSAAASS